MNVYDSWFRQRSRKIEAQANKLLKATKPCRRGKRKKRKPKIPKLTYHQYMGSAYWRKRKNDYFGKHGKSCAVCGKKYGTTLHHTFYDRNQYGREPDQHLVALCGKHHHEFHQHHPLSKDMRKQTEEYIATARQLLNSHIDDLRWIV